MGGWISWKYSRLSPAKAEARAELGKSDQDPLVIVSGDPGYFCTEGIDTEGGLEPEKMAGGQRNLTLKNSENGRGGIEGTVKKEVR